MGDKETEELPLAVELGVGAGVQLPVPVALPVSEPVGVPLPVPEALSVMLPVTLLAEAPAGSDAAGLADGVLLLKGVGLLATVAVGGREGLTLGEAVGEGLNMAASSNAAEALGSCTEKAPSTQVTNSFALAPSGIPSAVPSSVCPPHATPAFEYTDAAVRRLMDATAPASQGRTRASTLSLIALFSSSTRWVAPVASTRAQYLSRPPTPVIAAVMLPPELPALRNEKPGVSASAAAHRP